MWKQISVSLSLEFGMQKQGRYEVRDIYVQAACIRLAVSHQFSKVRTSGSISVCFQNQLMFFPFRMEHYCTDVSFETVFF
jgi:hypothetical protein